MSHITTVKTEINDLESLEVAARSCGLEFVREAKSYRWYYAPKACDHVLRVVGGNAQAYEVGVFAQGDGTFKLEFDGWNGGYGLMERIGPGAGKLMQAYAVARVYATMGHDHSIEHFTDEAGRVQMRLVPTQQSAEVHA